MILKKPSDQNAVYLSTLGIVCALGEGKGKVLSGLLSGSTDGMVPEDFELANHPAVTVGRVSSISVSEDQDEQNHESRSNRLLLLAAQEIDSEVRETISKYGAHRVGIVLGCSTSGIGEGEKALQQRMQTGKFPKNYSFSRQEMGDSAEFLANHFRLTSLAFTVSTACSSSAKVFGIGQELLSKGICDAVILGGVDSLCKLTVHGFHSLGILSPSRCNPFSKNRNGISLGEGAALFIMSREESEIRLAGWGDSSDAYHMTAPHPEGVGAKLCMLEAMKKVNLTSSDISYINLHGTGTLQNDLIEAMVVSEILSPDVPASSTKGMTGHALGAAGAIEAGLCWLLLSSHNEKRRLPPHVWDGQTDNNITLALTTGTEKLSQDKKNRMVSNSFAFGGSNSCIILERI